MLCSSGGPCVQSVPKYLCPKCVGATGCTSVVKMVMSGNSWIMDLAPRRQHNTAMSLGLPQ